jgi:hypothetical protein
MLIAETDLYGALARVAVATLRGIPEADGASVVLLDPPALGASGDRVERADRAQYDEREGPAPTAVAACRTVEAYRASVRLGDELRRGLVSRAVIDQAKGILVAQHGLDADQAFAVLTRFSQQENCKLRDVAVELVESSVREARTRHAR